MDKYDEKENIGRKLMQNILSHSDKITKYEFTTDKYNHIDVFATGKSLFCFEIKVRNIPSTLYDDYILEKIKYDALKQAFEESGYTPYYICFFEDRIFLVNINKLNITKDRIIKKRMTATTATNYTKCGVEKEVILLNKIEGKWLQYERS